MKDSSLMLKDFQEPVLVTPYQIEYLEIYVDNKGDYYWKTPEMNWDRVPYSCYLCCVAKYALFLLANEEVLLVNKIYTDEELYDENDIFNCACNYIDIPEDYKVVELYGRF